MYYIPCDKLTFIPSTSTLVYPGFSGIRAYTSLRSAVSPETAGGGITDRASWGTRSMRQSGLTEFSSDATCPECGRQFDTPHGMKTHRSMVHGSPTVECATCGTEQAVKPVVKDSRENHFCGRECYTEWRREQWSGKDHPSYDGGMVTVTCAHCGDEKELKPHAVRDKNFCDHDCVGAYRQERWTGTNSPTWRGGSSLVHAVRRCLSDRAWRRIRRDVTEGETCEMCGAEAAADGRQLSAHHIIPLRAGGDHGDYNLMPLCVECHARAEAFTWAIPEVTPVLTE